MRKSSLALMVNWTSWQLDSPVNQVQLPLCATFPFSFFPLIIVLEIRSAILEDGARAGNQSYLAKNNCRTFCNLVHHFHRITAKTRATLSSKSWPNKQYCQQNQKLTGSFDGQMDIMMAQQSAEPGSTCTVDHFSILFFNAYYTCRNSKKHFRRWTKQ